jgi:hypothetical protein
MASAKEGTIKASITIANSSERIRFFTIIPPLLSKIHIHEIYVFSDVNVSEIPVIVKY